MHLFSLHSTPHGINSLLLQDNLLWNNLPRKIKEHLSAVDFTKKMKGHGALPCSCVVCK